MTAQARVQPGIGEPQFPLDLLEAALEARPAAMQLRVLSTISEVASERNSTLIFPLRIELMRLIDSARTALDGIQQREGE